MFAVSTAALVLVLGLVVTEPWAEEESIPTANRTAMSATKTAEKGEPNLTFAMIEGVLDQYYQVYRETGYPEKGFLNCAACLISGENAMGNRMGDFKKSFDPKKKEWEIQIAGRYCDGIEYFFINEVTGKLSR